MKVIYKSITEKLEDLIPEAHLIKRVELTNDEWGELFEIDTHKHNPVCEKTTFAGMEIVWVPEESTRCGECGCDPCACNLHG